MLISPFRNLTFLEFWHSCGEASLLSKSWSLKWRLALCYLLSWAFIDVTIGYDQGPILKMYFAFCVLGILWRVVLTLHVPTSEMELVSSSSPLQPFDDVIADDDQAFIHTTLSQFFILALRDSYDEESRLLTPPTPSIQNSNWCACFRIFSVSHFGTLGLLWWRVLTLDSSNSRYPKLRLMCLFWNFQHFAFWHFGTHMMKSLDSWLLHS